MIAEKIGYQGEITWDQSKPDGTYRKLLDVRRINSMGWEAKIDINSGISSTCKEYKEQSRTNLYEN